MANGQARHECYCDSVPQTDHCAELVEERCRRNDPRRSHLFVARFSADVQTIVNRVAHGRSPQDREDAMQYAWTRIFAGMGSWSGRAPFCHWARVVAYRASVEWCEKNRLVDLIENPGTIPDREAPSEPGPACGECIMRTVAGLDPIEQCIFRRRYLDDPPATVEQVADELGVTPRTVHNRRAGMFQRINESCAAHCRP